MKIITISREFGSGGRELGKRLADALGIAYYDRELITMAAQQANLDEAYVERTLENGVLKQYPLTVSRTLASHPLHSAGSAPHILAQQHNIIRELAAKGDCVIVGRGSDAVLAEYHPLKIFVYADMDSRIARCKSRADASETLSERELERKIKQIDKARAANHALAASYAWGDKRGYHLCLNTTDLDIASVVPHLAAFAQSWFERRDSRNGNSII